MYNASLFLISIGYSALFVRDTLLGMNTLELRLKSLKYQDELHENNNIAEYGNRLFTSAQMDATAIIKHVYSWMKTINHSDARKQAGWCEDLLAMLSPANDTLETFI